MQENGRVEPKTKHQSFSRLKKCCIVSIQQILIATYLSNNQKDNKKAHLQSFLFPKVQSLRINVWLQHQVKLLEAKFNKLSRYSYSRRRYLNYNLYKSTVITKRKLSMMRFWNLASVIRKKLVLIKNQISNMCHTRKEFSKESLSQSSVKPNSKKEAKLNSFSMFKKWQSTLRLKLPKEQQ